MQNHTCRVEEWCEARDGEGRQCRSDMRDQTCSVYNATLSAQPHTLCSDRVADDCRDLFEYEVSGRAADLGMIEQHSDARQGA